MKISDVHVGRFYFTSNQDDFVPDDLDGDEIYAPGAEGYSVGVPGIDSGELERSRQEMVALLGQSVAAEEKSHLKAPAMNLMRGMMGRLVK
ncbi:MAG TPA: hypothetical protein VFL85_02000 [Candidatus Saccharimonadales bacterium]|nr:hypothetical protein [Candidatus Saccharimonadales bacterium]